MASPDINYVSTHPKYAEAFHQSLDEVAREEIHLAITKAPPIEKVRDYLRRNFESKTPQFFAIKETKDPRSTEPIKKIVGWADIRFQEHETLRHRGELGMGVLKSHRGVGIGARLLELCIEESRKTGVEIIHLSAYEDNAAALQLYRKFGFIEEGRISRLRKFQGRYQNAIIMALEL